MQEEFANSTTTSTWSGRTTSAAICRCKSCGCGRPARFGIDTIARVCAAKTAGCRITISTPPDLEHQRVDWLDRVTESWAASIEFVEETDEQLAEVIGRVTRSGSATRRPTACPGGARGGSQNGTLHRRRARLMHGRIELLWYVEEQSISDNYHRYGNLGARADEPRADVL